jgi:undecaprenyl-diphosphatase
MLGGLLIGSLWLLFGVMQDLIAGDPLVRADHAVLHLLSSLRVAWATRLAVWWTLLGSGPVIVVLALGSALWLDRQRAWRAMAYTLGAIFGAILFTAGLDIAVGRPAPFPAPAGLSLLPFPGTHLAVLTALLGFLSVVICRERAGPMRGAVMGATLLFLLGSLAARLYLGVDYLSTALEVMAFGAAWAVMLGLAYLVRPAEAVRPGGLSLIVLLAILGVGGMEVAIGQDAAFRQAMPDRGDLTMSRHAWLAGGWQGLPARPLSLFGTFGHPFAMQYLGPTRRLRAALSADGWRVPPAWRPGVLARMMRRGESAAQCPVLPRFDDGRLPVLVMIRTGQSLPEDERLVLRLWRSRTEVPGGSGRWMRIFYGAVALERVRPVWSLFRLPEAIARPDMSRRLLERSLTGPITLARRQDDATHRRILLAYSSSLPGSPR